MQNDRYIIIVNGSKLSIKQENLRNIKPKFSGRFEDIQSKPELNGKLCYVLCMHNLENDRCVVYYPGSKLFTVKSKNICDMVPIEVFEINKKCEKYHNVYTLYKNIIQLNLMRNSINLLINMI